MGLKIGMSLSSNGKVSSVGKEHLCLLKDTDKMTGNDNLICIFRVIKGSGDVICLAVDFIRLNQKAIDNDSKKKFEAIESQEARNFVLSYRVSEYVLHKLLEKYPTRINDFDIEAVPVIITNRVTIENEGIFKCDYHLYPSFTTSCLSKEDWEGMGEYQSIVKSVEENMDILLSRFAEIVDTLKPKEPAEFKATVIAGSFSNIESEDEMSTPVSKTHIPQDPKLKSKISIRSFFATLLFVLSFGCFRKRDSYKTNQSENKPLDFEIKRVS